VFKFQEGIENTPQEEDHNIQNQTNQHQQGQVDNAMAVLLTLEEITRRQREHVKELSHRFIEMQESPDRR